MRKTSEKRALRRLGDVIRARRVAAGLSQEKLAEQIGCHRNYVGYIERGEYNVTYGMLRRLAAGFGCGVSDLVRPAD